MSVPAPTDISLQRPVATPAADVAAPVHRTALPLVSIVAPVYNEEGVIADFITRLVLAIQPIEDRYRFEFILINDGSRDQSLAVMQKIARTELRLRVIELRRNYGQTPALQAGLDAARGEVLITLDSDLQHFPEEIHDFLKKLNEGYDVVCGWRQQRQEGLVRRWPSRAANRMMNYISGLKIHDFGTTYRAYRADVTRDLRLYGEFHRYIPVMAALLGAKITEIPIQNIERPKGKSNYGIGRTLGVFLDLILLYFFVHYMDRPMRAFGKLSLLSFLAGAGIIGVLLGSAYVYEYSAVRDRSGWFLMALVFLISGLQFLLAGILGEILIRIHYAQGDRRVYQIRHEWSAQNLDA